MSGEEGFLSRWSRRKRAVEPEETAPEVEVPPQAEAPAAAGEPPPVPAACPIPEVPGIDPATLPPVEELTASSDLGPFLRPGVPAALRAAALRRMWSVDPAIRDFIGCVDYQWDFNTPGGLPAGFASELGGDIGKLLAQAIGQRDEEEPEAKGPAAEPLVAETTPEPPPPPESPLRLEALPEPVVAAVDLPEEPAPLPRRRHGSALPS